ncbi:uncharacterized protein A1O5_10436 [Cladophialophora psammophila CBS 110553]|uniref:Metallo-beta-lactamase domain-containing protein n=1 Tax=Cladophialophora psammophila CBS 110553 TaxID=1182543 RepID=W9X767_9EURO|nr:uncharacterized protein A1O5_10436 [Cladophialophora psammophila CBS 110553]EXJ66284.1 hypothetical protein A1O5_10436 [Cladophialophora psammophila CBS 110553]
MAPSPSLNIPKSPSTVSVSVIETSSRIIAKTSVVVQPHIVGHDEFNCPCYSFLIGHQATGEKILFDLGIRKDPENLSPRTHAFTKAMSISSRVNVSDILGDEVSNISAIIWSHHHFDHIGDPSTFPPSTALVVGQGFKDEFLPGYPANQDSWIKESDYAGREFVELNFAEAGLKLGQYDAVDYFGDGSFYLLDCPGHTVAHIMGLARTTTDTFVLMAADCCHHGGEFRPSPYQPLPESIDLPVTAKGKLRPLRSPCPGSLFVKVHPKNSRTEAFYELNNPHNSDAVKEAMRSQRKLEEFDASEDVLVLTAHDSDAADVIDLYPKTVNGWKSKGWKQQLHWAFLHDFQVE